jgi:tRNA(fMet)-specific endonuclease VapC
VIWLLDTNTIAYALKYQGGVRDRINEVALRGDRVVTTVVVAAELLYGAERSARREENRRQIHTALARITPMPFTLSAAEHYARLKAHLASRGKLKARIDLLVAAAALDVGATLVTHDGDLVTEDMPDHLQVVDWYTQE